MSPDRESSQNKIWDKRWSFDEDSSGVSLLGRYMFRAKEKAIREIVREFKFGNVIEIGCGLGYTLSMYEEMGLRASGIDISARAVEICKSKNLDVKQISLEEVEDKYELVSSDGMLEHYLDFRPLVSKMVDIADSHVLVVQPNHESLLGKTLVYLSELIKGDKNVFEYNYRMSDFISVFDDCGASLEVSRPVFGDVFRLLLFKKKPGESQEID